MYPAAWTAPAETPGEGAPQLVGADAVHVFPHPPRLAGRAPPPPQAPRTAPPARPSRRGAAAPPRAGQGAGPTHPAGGGGVRRAPSRAASGAGHLGGVL